MMASYWNYIIISAAVIVLAVLLYLVLRWRKAQRAFRAMSLVATASLAAGVLIGVWSMHMLDAWMSTAGTNGGSSTSGGTSTRAISPGSGTPAAEVTPIGSGAASGAAPDRTSTVIEGYVGQALAQGYVKATATGRTEQWPQVDQGCRFGNYDRTSTLCRAAALAVHGWGDTQVVPLRDVAEFCDTNYLGETLALCLLAKHRDAGYPGSTATERTLAPDADGLPEADILEALRPDRWFGGKGPDGNVQMWANVSSLCARGVYASASPMCEAEAITKDGKRGGARVPVREVAAFCDVELIARDSEVCLAAYRLIQSASDLAR